MTYLISIIIIIGFFVLLDLMLFAAEVHQKNQDWKNGVRQCGRWKW
jgi:hypothetical protein